MSLPEFKFTNITKPTNDTTVNSGLSSKAKMVKSGIVPDIVDKAKLTAASLKTRVSDLSSSASSVWSGLKNRVSDIDVNVGNDDDIDDDGDNDNGNGGSSSFFSFTFIIKVILIIVIMWFMWVNLSNNGDFHLGMGDIGEKITAFFKKMEDSGRELVATITHASAPASARATASNASASESASTSGSDSDSDNEDSKKPKKSSIHQAPVPPSMNNSSDKKPGFNNEDTKYTFLDKASREYSGPSPRPDDSTSSTQKHQSGKAGYCYIGEDRGFRSCARVEAGDKCMSGEVFSRQDRCIDPTLRE